jgi:outer membrane protein OmpA-like peptidoglycan-associated protein
VITSLLPATRRIAMLLLAAAVCAGCQSDSPAAVTAPTGTGGGGAPAGSTAGADCQPRPGPVSLVVGVRADSAAPALPDSLRAELGQAAAAKRNISVVSVEGTPRVVFDEPFRSTGGNRGAQDRERANYLTRLSAAFAVRVKAVTPEADLLAALDKGTRTAPGGTLVVADSGLQTTGALRYQDGGGALLGAQPDEVATQLKRNGQLPDLTGRRVVLLGIGDTVAPQPRLSPGQRAAVRATWRTIAQSAVAACVAVLDDLQDGAAAGPLPPVSTVPIPAPPTVRPCGRTVLDERGDVRFVKNSASFIDAAAARATIATVADVMRAGRQTATLTGSTATSGTRAGRLALSKQRADAVKAVLVDLGIDSSRITTRGVGAEGPDHIPDLDSHQVLLPGPAARNRAVAVELFCRS